MLCKIAVSLGIVCVAITGTLTHHATGNHGDPITVVQDGERVDENSLSIRIAQNDEDEPKPRRWSHLHRIHDHLMGFWRSFSTPKQPAKEAQWNQFTFEAETDTAQGVWVGTIEFEDGGEPEKGDGALNFWNDARDVEVEFVPLGDDVQNKWVGFLTDSDDKTDDDR